MGIGVVAPILASIVLSACSSEGAPHLWQSQATVVASQLSGTATLTSTISAPVKSYTNAAHQVALSYPADWVKANDGYQLLVIKPKQVASWQPSSPADVAKNPAVTVTFGTSVQERLRYRNFPEEVNPQTISVWIEASDSNAQRRTISGMEAFEVIERAVPGCERVVYWRFISIDQLVRISTGCDSAYLDEFWRIVQSLQQINP